MPCDQCQVLSINGMACHETGCTNSWLHPVSDKPYKKDCKWCGEEFRPKEKFQTVCKRCAKEAR